MRPWPLLPLLLAILSGSPAAAAPPKVLFDNLKAETAGNADWIVDTDQPVPVPAQSGITWATPETYWLGAISAWGVQLAKRGYTVHTLSAPNAITYQNSANPYDLSNYDVYILPEPNIRFTAAESTAIFNFVRDGGGLVAVPDHWNSDRNNDGYDSPEIMNLLDAQMRWGIHSAVEGEPNNNIVQTSTNVNTSPTDSIIHGGAGDATALAFHNGTTFTLNAGLNPSVRGHVWMTGLSQGSMNGALVASSVYGNGRVVLVGDTSPADDGTGQPGNNLFFGWNEAGGSDSLVFLNATLWATRRAVLLDRSPPVVTVITPNGGEEWHSYTVHEITWNAVDNARVDSVRIEWSPWMDGQPGTWTRIASGIANSGTYSWLVPNLNGCPPGIPCASDSFVIRVTAWDPSLNARSDVSDAPFRSFDVTGVDDPGEQTLVLTPPSPNPAHGATRIRFSLPAPGPARIELVDLAGRRVWRIEGTLASGSHSVQLDEHDAPGGVLAAGIYFVRLTTPWGSRSARLVWLR